MPESVDPRHLLLIGAGPGVGAGVVRRFGREGFRSTLISRGGTLEQLAAELRSEGVGVETVVADASDLDTYPATLESLNAGPGAPAVLAYNASMFQSGKHRCYSVEHLRTAYDVDVLGGVVAAQAAPPVMRAAATGTISSPGSLRLARARGHAVERQPPRLAFVVGEPPEDAPLDRAAPAILGRRGGVRALARHAHSGSGAQIPGADQSVAGAPADPGRDRIA